MPPPSLSQSLTFCPPTIAEVSSSSKHRQIIPARCTLSAADTPPVELS